MRVVVVDWLGRGGIAQTSAVWARELRARGSDVTVVTRPRRDLPTDVHVPEFRRGGPLDRIGSHRAVVAAAVTAILDRRPDLVVVQNYVLPVLESAVGEAARSVGASLTLVVHDHQLHTLRAGLRWGLRRSLVRADAVLVHSEYVAQGLANFAGIDAVVVPLPRVIGALALPDSVPLLGPGCEGDRLALHFGVVRRGYKGVATIREMAAAGLIGWRFGCVGVGAPGGAPGLHVVSRFLTEGELAAVVAASDVSLLPYQFATQSGAVAFAQSVGSVPIASAVGGIPEQIQNGVTGVLVRPGAPASEWLAALHDLDAEELPGISAAAVQQSHRSHAAFVSAIEPFAGCSR